MKPDWDALGEQYGEGSSVVIGDVDCTADGKSLCERFEVRGYPTVKYFTSDTGEKGADYQQARSLDALKAFVEKELAVMCTVESKSESCDEREQKYIEKMQAKGGDAIKAQHERLTKMKGSKMNAGLKKWLNQRINILSQLL